MIKTLLKTTKTSKVLRQFGLLIGGLLGGYALLPLLWHGGSVKVWIMPISVGVVGISIFRPDFLALFYALWMAIGRMAGYVNNRIILSVIYYCVFTPFGLWRRLLRRDVLDRNFNTCSTYRVTKKSRPSTHMAHVF